MIQPAMSGLVKSMYKLLFILFIQFFQHHDNEE